MIEIKMLKKKKLKQEYLGILDGNKGIETYVNENMFTLHPGYIRLVVEFLKEITEELEEKLKQEKPEPKKKRNRKFIEVEE